MKCYALFELDKIQKPVCKSENCDKTFPKQCSQCVTNAIHRFMEFKLKQTPNGLNYRA